MTETVASRRAIEDENLVHSNGVDAETGGYLLPPLAPDIICRIAEGNPINPTEFRAIQSIYRPDEDEYLGVVSGLDANNLAQVGWGAVFAQDVSPQIVEALHPLLELREQQAGDFFYLFTGSQAYVPGMSSSDWRAMFGAGPNPVRPEVLPYYILLVGDADSIPFEFQYQLDVIHAVGRVCFDTVEEYAAYARLLVRAESGHCRRARSLGFFAPQNPGDVPTRRSSQQLVRRLSMDLAAANDSWTVESRFGEHATKPELSRFLGGDLTPALLFTASHGIGFSEGHPLQRDHQGALLCQEWPGPMAQQAMVPPEQYFSAEDLISSADLQGTLAFFFACYSLGTPDIDDFAPGREASYKAPLPFTARLPQRMLSKGTLAVIGHVDRAWAYSFMWPRAGTDVEVFRSTIKELIAGSTVGWAMEYFNTRYAAIATELNGELRNRRFGKQNDTTIAGLWTANHDARNYAVLGDPAVHLRTGRE